MDTELPVPAFQESEAPASASVQVSATPRPGRLAELLRFLICAGSLTIATLAALWWSAPVFSATPLLSVVRETRLIPTAAAALLLALAGLAGSLIMVSARSRASSPSAAPRPRRRWRLSHAVCGDPAAVGRAARWPQVVVVASLCAMCVLCAWLPLAASAPPLAPATAHIVLAAAILVLAFPLLIAERLAAAVPPSLLPEAAALRALMLLPVLAWPAAGLLQIAASLGIPFADRLSAGIGVALTAVAAELALRALGRCFLPPPPAAEARAAINSLLAQLIADGLRARSLAAPVRQHLGLDFSRSWALAYLRSAAAPVAGFLLLVFWSLSGVVLVGLDQRAVYERFGEPVSVLQPGLHAILPWPMGQVRRLEFGTLHETTLAGADVALPPRPVGAEDLPPPDADRLWEQAHPGELTFLIASESSGQQTFQIISADIKLRYRIGMTDRDALRAAYNTADPESLLRGAAGKTIARFFADQTLDAVLGANREALAGQLRTILQRQLDAHQAGIELSAVVIEAIHPPAGAAEAYHAVQAAQILAVTSISAERGRALAEHAKAQQYATDLVTQSTAAGAETTATATADLTAFNADYAAATAHEESFLLERRLSAIATGLAKSTLTIIDHRIPAAEAPTLDLRPLTPTTAASAGPGQE